MTQAATTTRAGKCPGKPRAVGIGLLGAGWMGRLHTEAYARIPFHYPDCLGRAKLVAVCDPDPTALEHASRLGYGETLADPIAVIEHPDVEAVSIATPNSLHRGLALAAIRAGKPFWGEKPLGRFPQDTVAIAEALRAMPVPTTVGLNYRHVPVVEHARTLIAHGTIGDVRSYRGYFLVDYASDPTMSLSWRFLRGQAGLGVIGDLMSHCVDMAHNLVGPIVEVNGGLRTEVPRRPRACTGTGGQFERAGGELGDVENDDSAWAAATFASGARGSFEVSRTTVSRHCTFGFEVFGSDGALAWEFQRMNELQVYAGAGAGGDAGTQTVYAAPGHGDFGRFEPGPGVSMGYSDLKVTEARLFLDSVVDGRQRAPGVEEMLAAMRVIDAILRSAETGAWAQVHDDA